jgi:quercetin dioxygenase-like cupin family protein
MRIAARLLVATVFASAARTDAMAQGADDVTYFPAAQVTAAFDKGAVLLDGAGRNYMVHASRRDEAGQAEVHAKDTDIIYVLDGSTTFVTGGTVVDGKPTAPGEIRGSAVRDGETRRLAKGDVIVVPSGTPHWFKDVDGPVLYYVVKVR